MNKGEILKATHSGELKIGDTILPCSVLEDGTRVLTELGISKAFGGRTGTGIVAKRDSRNENGSTIPSFVAIKTLKPFISEELEVDLRNPILFQRGNAISAGYNATLLPKICDVWISAKHKGVLKGNSNKKADLAYILYKSLANVGIIALVDEATGYQDYRARNALEEILNKFIAKEIREWVKTFPDEYYQLIFKLNGWSFTPPFPKKKPGIVGRWTNDLVYERLAPGVFEELKRITPPDKRLHQNLSENFGHPKLKEHLHGLIVLMRASSNWTKFQRLVSRAYPKQDTFPELPMDYPEED